jgi:hypothetical protein
VLDPLVVSSSIEDAELTTAIAVIHETSGRTMSASDLRYVMLREIPPKPTILWTG